jgi:hypothetical protein
MGYSTQKIEFDNPARDAIVRPVPCNLHRLCGAKDFSSMRTIKPCKIPLWQFLQFPVLASILTLLLGASDLRAANLLINPSFEQNNGHVIPSAWTRFAPPTALGYGDYATEGQVTPQAGLLYFKEWGACYNGTNNAAGIYQDLSSAPGSTYQASGWLYTSTGDRLGADCYVWVEVSLLGSSGNLLAL